MDYCSLHRMLNVNTAKVFVFGKEGLFQHEEFRSNPVSSRVAPCTDVCNDYERNIKPESMNIIITIVHSML